MRAHARVVSLLATLVLAAAPAAPSSAADPAHDIQAYCSYTRTAVAIAYTGVARTPEQHGGLVDVALRCRFVTDAGQVTASGGGVGPVAALSGTGVLAGGAVTVCESATATFADGHTTTLPERCGAVRAPVPVTGSDVGPASVGCVSQRQTGRWVIAATGAGPARTVPAVATTVTCTLADTAGNRPTVQIEESGNAAAIAAPVSGPFVTLASRCATVRTAYLDGVVRSHQTCEHF